MEQEREREQQAAERGKRERDSARGERWGVYSWSSKSIWRKESEQRERTYQSAPKLNNIEIFSAGESTDVFRVRQRWNISTVLSAVLRRVVLMLLLLLLLLLRLRLLLGLLLRCRGERRVRLRVVLEDLQHQLRVQHREGERQHRTTAGRDTEEAHRSGSREGVGSGWVERGGGGRGGSLRRLLLVGVLLIVVDRRDRQFRAVAFVLGDRARARRLVVLAALERAVPPLGLVQLGGTATTSLRTAGGESQRGGAGDVSTCKRQVPVCASVDSPVH
jgi:hypothetical protein